jgi:hypothetical protein
MEGVIKLDGTGILLLSCDVGSTLPWLAKKPRVTFLVDGVRVSAKLANGNRDGNWSVHAELQSLLDDMTGDDE